MRQGLLQVCFFMIGMGLTISVSAQDRVSDNRAPGFRLQKNDFLLTPRLSSTLESAGDKKSTYRTVRQDAQKSSYDAIFYYPLHRQGISIDVGVNLRVQEDRTTPIDQIYSYDQDWLSIDPGETRTMLHAAAVFDLPFSGLTAGLSGTYNADLENAEFDYRAKLSYKWKNGLGLEGGWLHQQKAFEQQNFNDTLDAQTLFLDMKYRF